MTQETGGLSTPWIRDGLLDHLRNLADHPWLDMSLPQTREGIEDALDFFDTYVVLDDPSAQIGFFLQDDEEAAALTAFATALKQARGSKDGPAWHEVGLAAAGALGRLRSNGPY